MKRLVSILFTALLFSVSASATPTELACIQKTKKVVDKLKCLDSVSTVKENKTASPKHIEIFFKQPVNHFDPSDGTFLQRLVLIHKSENEPMVLQTSGYSIFGVWESVLTQLFETNQIQVEHRFFSQSKPASLDWSKLDIRQSAEDFHRITTAFKQIYPKNWVGTGASKGGMTSIYHRYFYPNDLDGTVADVAPLSFSTTDQRYVRFVDEVGGEAYRECREKMKAWQMGMLQDRALFIPKITGDYTHLGSNDVAFEHAVIEAAFYFWQYGDPDSKKIGCSAIPIQGTTEERFGFLNELASLKDNYSDQAISKFMPYFFQAATELGCPDNLVDHLQHLRKYEFSIDQYTPKNTKYKYSNTSMYEVDTWARQSADRILYIYGEFDPWSAGEFPTTETGKDVFKFYVPKGNHGAEVTMLKNAEKKIAMDALTRWFGKAPALTDLSGIEKNLEQIEFIERRRLKL